MALPKLKAAKPVGSLILVDILSSKDIIDTPLIIEEKIQGVPQAIILDMGPMVNKDYGFKVGDRIVMTGNYTPLPELSSQTKGRTMGLCEPHNIKAILIEEDVK